MIDHEYSSEELARAISHAAITHDVVGDVPEGVIERMIENLAIKFFPEARATIPIIDRLIAEAVAEERAAAVGWLRTPKVPRMVLDLLDYGSLFADAIECGDHRAPDAMGGER